MLYVLAAVSKPASITSPLFSPSPSAAMATVVVNRWWRAAADGEGEKRRRVEVRKSGMKVVVETGVEEEVLLVVAEEGVVTVRVNVEAEAEEEEEWEHEWAEEVVDEVVAEVVAVDEAWLVADARVREEEEVRRMVEQGQVAVGGGGGGGSSGSGSGGGGGGSS